MVQVIEVPFDFRPVSNSESIQESIESWAKEIEIAKMCSTVAAAESLVDDLDVKEKSPLAEMRSIINRKINELTAAPLIWQEDEMPTMYTKSTGRYIIFDYGDMQVTYDICEIKANDQLIYIRRFFRYNH